MATTAMLDLRKLQVVQAAFDRLAGFTAHLARPDGLPLWSYGPGSTSKGTVSRDAWDALVYRLAELEAEDCGDGLDDPAAGGYLDGATITVGFELFDGRHFSFRVEPMAVADLKRDSVLQAIGHFERACEESLGAAK